MSNTAKTKTYGLIALALLALGLWWWLAPGREPVDPARDASADAAASKGASTEPERPAPLPLRGSDVDPWKAPRAAVSGTVRNEQGEPIAGAQVCARLQDDALAELERHPPRCVTTRQDGTYRIDELLAAEHHLFASARGYLPGRHETRRGIQAEPSPRVDLHGGATRTGVDFVLKAGGVEVTGVVKDIAGGEIEGAWVSSGRGWWGNQGVAFTRSDAEGRFSLWVEPPEAELAAFAEGYAAGTRRAAVPGTFVELFLTPESVVVGKVVWAGTTKPVAGARVWANGGIFGPSGGPVYSDDAGTFRLEGLQPGAYKLSALGEAFTGQSAQKIHVGLGQTSAPVVVEVHPAFAVRGTVLVDGTTPCSYAYVVLKLVDREQDPGRGGGGEEDGTILVEGVLPGTYEVSVTCDGYLAEDSYPPVVVSDAPLEGLTWSVHAGRAIRGTVVDAHGKPVANAHVSATGKAASDPRARRSNQWGERTAADGSFVVDGLLPDTYELSVYHDHLPSPVKPIEVVVPADADATDVVLTLPASGEVRGIVRDAQAKPVADATVRLRGGRWGGEARTNDEGRFTLPSVEAGEYRISAQRGWSDTMRAPGASDDDAAGQRIQVTADASTEVELVVESQGGRITGRVLAEGGEPVADAFVEAVRESDSAAASMAGTRMVMRWGAWGKRPPVLTDEDGRFTLDDLAEQGVYTVHAHRKGGGEATAEHVKVGADVQLDIADAGALAGTVTLAGGGFPRRFEISVTDMAAGVWETEAFLLTNGKWRVEGLPPGKYQISVDAAEGNAKTEVALAEGDEKTDVALQLVPRVTLRGRLVDGRSGEPIAGLQVKTMSEGGGFFLMMNDEGTKADRPDISDAQGRFTVEDAPSGKVMLMIMQPDGAQGDYGWTWISRRVPAEPREQDLGDLELFADRVGPGKEAGDLGFKTKAIEPDTEPEARRHVVAFVRPGGPAAAAGLAVGDEIVTVDGEPVTGFDTYRYETLTNVLPGTEVALGLAGDRSITITAGPPE